MKFNNIQKSTKEVLKDSKYFFLFVLLSIIVLVIYLFLPLIGNQTFKVSNYPFKNILLAAVLSFLIGLLFTMQIYSFRQSRELNIASNSGGIMGFVSGFAIILFSSATCFACLSVILAFLGTGTLLSLFAYKNYIIIAGFFLIFVSLYLISNKVQEQCELCKVPEDFLKKKRVKKRK